MNKLLKSALLAATAIAVCSAPAFAEVKVKAVASFSILADLTSVVGGDRAAVTAIVGPDGDAHVYEPQPADAKTLSGADLIIVNGLGFEGWLDRLIEASGYKGRVIRVSDGVAIRKMTEEHEAGHQSEEAEHPSEEGEQHSEGEHQHGELDPHAWQSVRNAMVYVKNIAAALCAADAEGCPTYEANAKAYASKLETLDADIRADLAKVPPERRTIITSHDAFGYLAAEYGLKVLAPEGVSTDSEASAADVAELIRQIRADKASALFVENISDPRLIEQIARETGLTVGGELYTDALSPPNGPAPTYIDMMRHNARLLALRMLGS